MFSRRKLTGRCPLGALPWLPYSTEAHGTAGGGGAAAHGVAAAAAAGSTGAASTGRISDAEREEMASVILHSLKHQPTPTAKALAECLDARSRDSLVAALSALGHRDVQLSRQIMAAEQEVAASPTPQPAQPPSRPQLLWVALIKGLPFIAFGFFDNVIMISAGEEIDAVFGAKLGLSSMMAAGLGNAVADVLGIQISQSIEQRFKSQPWMASPLTAAQAAMHQTKRAKWLGCTLGMATGCLLGLLPLAFVEAKERRKQQALQQAAAAAS